ncbi:hypothetical protein ACQP1U_00310 [Actinomycetota bacterium]
MSEDDWDASFDREFERLLELPSGTDREPLLRAMAPQAREQARRMLAVADLAWVAGQGAPPLEEDPVAAMLGLVPDPGYQLNPAALKRARTKANMKPTVLAAALSRRGWSVSAGDVFHWERTGEASMSPALLRAVAAELHAEPDALTGTAAQPASAREDPRHATARSVASEVAQTPTFKDLVARFARIQGVSLGMAGSTLHARMLATVHRGDHPTAEQMLASVEGLVRALEQDDSDL